MPAGCLFGNGNSWVEGREGGFPGSLARKESTYNAGDPDLIPWSVRSSGEDTHTPVFLGFPGGSDSKESACNARDLSSIPGLGRFPGGGHGKPLQYSYLENPHGQRSLAATVCEVTKSQTRLSD